MIAFFPHPYPDELFYSVLARYHVWSGNQSAKTTLFDLFGSNTPTATVDLPSHIIALVSNLPSGARYTAEHLINKHTLYPYYAPFLAEERAIQIMQSMKDGSGGNIHTRAGIMANSIPSPTHLRFCTECLQQDLKEFGEMYWHRTHQLPGVLICPFHKILLHDSTIATRFVNKHEYIAASPVTCQVCNPSLLYGNRIMAELYALAKNSEWLLLNPQPSQGLSFFRTQYINALHTRELAIKRTSIDQKELLRNFVGFYDEEYLTLLYSNVDMQRDSNWLSTLFRKPRKATHPIRHLLVIRWLTRSIEQVFLRPILSKNHLISNTNVSILPNKCCDTLVSNLDNNTKHLNYQQRYRLKWISIQKEYPQYSKTQLRNREPAVFAWLYRCDRIWLNANSPRPVQRKSSSNRVDWHLRDEEIFTKVVEAVNFLKSMDKPIRITLSKIGRSIGYLGIMEKHISKMPKTKEYLKRITETVEEFQIRRVRWAAKRINESGQLVKAWKVSRLAGLDKDISGLVRNEIEYQVSYYNLFAVPGSSSTMKTTILVKNKTCNYGFG